MTRSTRVDNPDVEPVLDSVQDEWFAPSTQDETKMQTAPTQAPIDDRSRQWTNRRRMAWLALLSILVVTGMILFVVPEPRLIALAPILDMFYIGMVSIVGAFIGFQTWFNIRRGK